MAEINFEYAQKQILTPEMKFSCCIPCSDVCFWLTDLGFSEHLGLSDILIVFWNKKYKHLNEPTTIGLAIHAYSMALLRLVQNIIQGFNDGEMTIGVFVDMEKAFDSVWRNVLLAKLHDMGIAGKIWGWLQSFLDSRQAYCYMKGSVNAKFSTEMGLPQGLVLSPLFFNLFIKDIYADVQGKKVKLRTMVRFGRLVLMHKT